MADEIKNKQRTMGNYGSSANTSGFADNSGTGAISRDSPLKKGARFLANQYVQGAKDFGNRVSGIAESLVTPSTPETPATSSPTTPVASTNKLGEVPASPNTATTTTPATKASTTSPKPVLGGTLYSQDKSGNVIKRSPTGETTTLNVGLPQKVGDRTRAEIDAANISQSRQIHQDWENYKAEKERKGQEQYYKNMMQSAFLYDPTGRTVNTNLLQAGLKGLESMRSDVTEREKAGLAADVQARQLGTTARKNAFEEQLQLGKFESEAQNRLAGQTEATLKLIGDVNKNLGNEQDKVAIYKQRDMWNPTTVKSVYTKERLGSFQTPEELASILANDETIDSTDRDAIMFSYFGNQ